MKRVSISFKENTMLHNRQCSIGQAWIGFGAKIAILWEKQAAPTGKSLLSPGEESCTTRETDNQS